MPTTITTTDLRPLFETADQTAARLCKKVRSPWLEPEDVRQDLLLDLFTRLKSYDRERGTLPAFAAVCFHHRSARLSHAAQRERMCRHPSSLESPLPGSVDLTLADTVAEADGYGAWMGQQIDSFAAVEQSLDLDRALTTLSCSALHLCAVLMQDEPDPAGAAGLPRTTFHRRVHDLRCHMLAAGLGGRVERIGEPVGI